ncbi:MAG: hypothetical protein JO250_13545 [Armatimonadetes bacterium]|nr:hypothetical protein [Armatimonadota bacterium]
MRNTVATMTVRRFLLVLALGSLSIVSLCSPAAAAPRRIHIPHGHGTIYVHGHLHGFRSRVVFVLHAHRGRTLTLSMVRGGPTVIMLRFPNGQEDGAPGGVEDVLPRTGDYRITLSEHLMGGPWRGPFTLKVRLH